MINRKVFILSILVLVLPVSSAQAGNECCAYQGGVCGCRCCDGSLLSPKCLKNYPQCKSEPTKDEKKGLPGRISDQEYAREYLNLESEIEEEKSWSEGKQHYLRVTINNNGLRNCKNIWVNLSFIDILGLLIAEEKLSIPKGKVLARQSKVFKIKLDELPASTNTYQLSVLSCTARQSMKIGK